jgi:diguanylate cyclase (GGDEF)-like protein/PAS domain S-box-containing protein
MQPLDAAFVKRVLDSAPEGVAICDATAAGYPVMYVNAAFEQMTGFAAGEVEGQSLRMLQGTDRDQDGIRKMREALSKGEPCRVLLRNYRKNGELLWNELALQPMRDESGAVTHYVGFYRDATGRLKQTEKAQETVPTWLREDRITGLSSRAWFNELLAREWRIARRDGLPLTLALFDIDALGAYNATFGKSAGDACLRRIGHSIAGVFRRGSDVVGIWNDGCICVLAVHREGAGVSGVVAHSDATVRRVADMHIHHPRSPLQKFVTVTASIATVTPLRDEEEPTRLIEGAQQTLKTGKREQRGSLHHATV